jgi:hypothetical protein
MTTTGITIAPAASGRDQVPAALAYLADQHTDVLREALTVSRPAEAYLITVILNRRCDGSGFRISSDDRALLGLCDQCKGEGC